MLTSEVVINMSAQQTSLLTELGTILSTELSFEGFLTNFHFIRPWWLLAFCALFLLLFLLKKVRYYQSPWQHFLPAHLANTLLENTQNMTANVASTSTSRYWLKPLVIGCCIIIALAGPAWKKLPQPVFQLERGAVLVMDMSLSMYATDVKPNRLTRARYKAIDLLSKINEGDIGLIAYAGDAFIISPLTQDIKNIELLLPSLSPEIMPVYGANALAALTLADKTLKNSGHISGDIYWFTDDIDNEERSDVYAWSKENNHKINILGIGSVDGAPIKLSSGELLKDNRGAIVIPKLPAEKLAAISKRSRGIYRTMTNDDSDIGALTAHLSVNLDDELADTHEQENQVMQGDQYHEHGPWLLLIILPFLLSYFRKGAGILSITWFLPLTLMASLMTTSHKTYAQEQNTRKALIPSAAETVTPPKTSTAQKIWRDLWQTPDQQAQQYFQKKEYQKAAKQFDNSQWQGSAYYKAGDFEQALQAFQQSDSAQSLYNQGNTLAQLDKVDEAIDAYKQALAKDPSLTDAKDNLAKLEALKKQQKQSQQPQDSQQDKEKDQQEQDAEQQSQDKSQGDKQQSEQEQDSRQQGDSPQNSEKTQQQQDEQDKESQESQNAEQQEQEKQQDEQLSQAKKSEQEQNEDGEKSLAQKARDAKAQETQQKHQQLLNKVTDDPYLLLRNKMRLEYQKRRNEGAPRGETKKW